MKYRKPILIIKPLMRSEKHLTSLKKRIHKDFDDNIRFSERLYSVTRRPRLNTIHS